MSTIIILVILLFSAILHEIAHGAVAEYFGDYTARDMGRITINPLVHIDPVYSVLIPFLMISAGSPIVFGAAKPVPVNYNNLRNFRWGVFWVSIAGILTNLFIAFVFSLLMRFAPLSEGVFSLFSIIVQLNILLAVINMIPIPPIDGSKVIASLLGEGAIDFVTRLESSRFSFITFFILIYFLFLTPGFQLVMTPIENFFFRLFGLA
jgi:Zn-dependent protease